MARPSLDADNRVAETTLSDNRREGTVGGRPDMRMDNLTYRTGYATPPVVVIKFSSFSNSFSTSFSRKTT